MFRIIVFVSRSPPGRLQHSGLETKRCTDRVDRCLRNRHKNVNLWFPRFPILRLIAIQGIDTIRFNTLLGSKRPPTREGGPEGESTAIFLFGSVRTLGLGFSNFPSFWVFGFSSFRGFEFSSFRFFEFSSF